MVIGAGKSQDDLEELQQFLHLNRPQGVIDRTTAYWRLWLAASRARFPDAADGGPSKAAVDLFKRSLLVVRTQIDNNGAIIAANDTDIMQFSRDTYSYLWPRDGALVAAALDDAGFPDVARSFYKFCAEIIDDGGYFLHKYNPDGSPASSWHPWVSLGSPQLPIQEDETALVLWALWRHYQQYRDIEFVRPLWVQLITKAADFLVRFRDPDTHLPLPSYDLWEERWGVHAFTVASVYGGLKAAWQFAVCFGDTRRADAYAKAAEQLREAFCKHMWSPQHERFLRRIVPLDHNRTAALMAQVLAGRSPGRDRQFAALGAQARQGDASAPGGDANVVCDTTNADSAVWRHSAPDAAPPCRDGAPEPAFELDPIIDASMFAIFAFGLLDPHDQRVEKTMAAIETRLWIRTDVGGMARYEGDYYHRISEDIVNVPGNPWFICTLWLADWRIARAGSIDELREALPILDWVAAHALPSGVLAEQVHPFSNAPLSVSPLTWSHATVVSTMVAYLHKLESMTLCPTCGQPWHEAAHGASTAGRMPRLLLNHHAAIQKPAVA
jgi:GH15 family glucan-1,4-alpha-glucosidase